jgi:hypothetical protein
MTWFKTEQIVATYDDESPWLVLDDDNVIWEQEADGCPWFETATLHEAAGGWFAWAWNYSYDKPDKADENVLAVGESKQACIRAFIEAFP